MDRVRSAGTSAGAKLKKAVAVATEQGYFDPLCTEKHLSVRHWTSDSFKYVGDATHLLALVLCLAVILRENGTDGVSFKTHLVYFIVFNARFLNILFCDQSTGLIIYKVLLWTFTLKIVILMWVLGSSSDKKDTLPLAAILVFTFLLTFVFGVYSAADRGLCVEFLWIFSTYLESIAMLPQYVYCYRDAENTSPVVLAYVFAMGGYQMVFGLSWAHRWFTLPYDLDGCSFLSGILGVAFFCDYIVFKVARRSTLSHVFTTFDDTLREANLAAWGVINGDQSLGDFVEQDEHGKGTNGARPRSPRNRSPRSEVELHAGIFGKPASGSD